MLGINEEAYFSPSLSAEDIARWRVKLIFMFNQLEILFDDMLGHTGYHVYIINIFIALMQCLNSMIILDLNQ